ncbi:MAG: ABC-type nitrate/sulfonate/bicarbonate transport system, permease component [Bacillales bacterium]|jgi:ABC-type nitrate/sulfonate/bicarbonate transport system permease component|nr:ABC-type nitrate/sulfonate/bicarbonate transport system, permease component [Bacillales bacterium]
MKKNIIYIFSILIVFFTWDISIRIFHISPWILPSPFEILKELVKFDSYLFEHIKVTFFEATIGLILSIVFALLIFLLMISFKTFNLLIKPYLIVSQAMPIITIAPLIIIWFGYGIFSKVAVVVFVCSFPIIISLSEALKTLPTNQRNFFIINGASKLSTFRYLIFPHSLPFFFSGLRIGATYAITGAIIGEWLGASQGLGVYLTRVSKSFQTEKVFAAIIIISVLSLILYLSVIIIEYLVLPWKRKRKGVFTK